jgi:predicted extracellular nuclease
MFIFHRIRGKLWACTMMVALIASFLLPCAYAPLAEVTSAQSPTTVVISEVCYNAADSNGSLEWVELYNPISSPVDLSTYSLGHGGADYTYSKLQLSGVIDPRQVLVVDWPVSNVGKYSVYFPLVFKGYFVAGGPASSDSNGSPVNAGRTEAAGGVALFNVPANDVMASTCPIDAVIYGGVNKSSLLDETCQPGMVDVAGVSAGSSVERITLAGAWWVQNTPTPGWVPFPAEAPPIVINEIMVDPDAVPDSAGEWFELYNAASEPVDIQGWRIRSGVGELHTIGASLVIPVGGYVVLGNNSSLTANGGVIVDYVYSGITLADDIDRLSLEYGDETVDGVSYNSTGFLVSPGASIQLISPTLDNDVGANWRRAHIIWLGSAGDRGTPGAANNADTTSPEVDSTSPDSGATGVDVNANVSATFSEAMYPATINDTIFSLTGPGGAVTGTVAYNADTFVATFTPGAALDNATTYAATILGAVTDFAGNPLGVDYTWSFTTASGLPPVIVINEIMQNPSRVNDNAGEWFELHNPTDADVDINGWTIKDNDLDSHVIDNGGPLLIAPGDYLVLGNNADSATNGGVQVDYEYPGNWYLANGADEVVLLDADLNEIDRVEYDGGPEFPDPNGASMALIAPDLDNNVGANWYEENVVQYGVGDYGTPGWENGTSLPDTEPPRVVSTDPGNGETNVRMDTNVRATFNEAINEGTLNFTLAGPDGPVAGSVSYDSGSFTATFNPDDALGFETVYTATIAAGLEDIAGNATTDAYTWSFTTGVFVPAPVLISEVQTGGLAGGYDEFIELYNPSDTEDFDLNGYRVVYRSATGTTDFSCYRWTTETVTIIPPHRHYLLTNRQGYSGTVLGDVTYSQGLSATGGGLAIRDPEGNIVDSVGWGTATNIFVETSPVTATVAGESIERKPGGDEGNGQDTNDNSVDFQVISPPNPQNLASPPVPPIGPPFVPIYEIQGDGFVSPYDGQQVATTGVVIADFQDTGKNDFFIQDVAGDDNPFTSDGIFVYEGGNTVNVALGDLVTVVGTADEYYDNTQIVLQTVTVDSSGNLLPAPVELNPPFDNTEALTYYEALEGMLVSAPDCVVVGPSNGYGEFVVVRADLGITRVFQDDPAGTGERIMVDDEGGLRYYVKVDDNITGLIGPLDYTFGNYKVQQRDALTVTVAPDPGVHILPELASDEFSVATFNLENLFDTVDEPDKDDPVPPDEEYQLKLTKLAAAINAMGGPTILAVQEAENAAVLADLAAGTVVSYQVTLVDGPDARGIDVGLLTHSERVTMLGAEARQTCTTLDDTFGPRVDPNFPCPEGENPLFSRPPLVVNLTVDKFPLTVIVNHFKSKSQDTPEQQVTLPRRVEQAQWVASLVDEVLATDSQADVILLGDLNDFLDSEPLSVLTGSGRLRDVLLDVEKQSRYTYIYTGESEVLDHVLVSLDLEAELQGVTPFHINADFPVPQFEDDTLRRSSDHDAVLTWFRLASPVAAFTAKPIYARVGQDVVFTNGSTGDEPLTFLWNFGDGMTSGERNPTHAYAAEGDYTVILTVSNALGSDQASTVIHVGLAPDAAFSYSPESPWVGEKVSFTNKSTGTEPLSYEWDFGDGDTSTETHPQHVYAKSGTYLVRLTATNPWGSDTATAEITVSQPPLSVNVHSMLIRWTKCGRRNSFATEGKLKLPSGYSREDLEKKAVVSIRIGAKTASEEVVFRKCGRMWFTIRKGRADGNLDIKLMTIYWGKGHSGRQAIFRIIGTAEFPGVGADTKPPKVTLELHLPLREQGELVGSDTVTCAVRRDWWVFWR